MILAKINNYLNEKFDVDKEMKDKIEQFCFKANCVVDSIETAPSKSGKTTYIAFIKFERGKDQIEIDDVIKNLQALKKSLAFFDNIKVVQHMPTFRLDLI
ncbi:MAG: hypothetical protein WC346_13265 [Methanogenium sp.]|jgi:prephenate dehydratase